MRRFFSRLNILSSISDHLLDRKKHCFKHRACIGIFVMLIGVAISQVTHFLGNHFLAFAGDTIGYFLHGLGGLPMVEKIAEMFND